MGSTGIPPINDEELEQHLISLALLQVETELKEKKASAQTLNHFLRLASKKYEIELEKLKLESQLIEAKISSENRGEHLEDLAERAFNALRGYQMPPIEYYDEDIY